MLNLNTIWTNPCTHTNDDDTFSPHETIYLLSVYVHNVIYIYIYIPDMIIYISRLASETLGD